jgi:hypothetical protein
MTRRMSRRRRATPGPGRNRRSDCEQDEQHSYVAMYDVLDPILVDADSCSQQDDQGGVCCAWNDCAICITPLHAEPHVRLQCNHGFHQACIEEWVKSSQSATCPLCRQVDPALEVLIEAAVPTTYLSIIDGGVVLGTLVYEVYDHTPVFQFVRYDDDEIMGVDEMNYYDLVGIERYVSDRMGDDDEEDGGEQNVDTADMTINMANAFRQLAGVLTARQVIEGIMQRDPTDDATTTMNVFQADGTLLIEISLGADGATARSGMDFAHVDNVPQIILALFRVAQFQHLDYGRDFEHPFIILSADSWYNLTDVRAAFAIMLA